MLFYYCVLLTCILRSQLTFGFILVYMAALAILASVLSISSGETYLSIDSNNEIALHLSSTFGRYSICPRTFVLFDDYFWEDEDFVYAFLQTYNRPITLFTTSRYLNASIQKNLEAVCTDVLIFSRDINEELISIYKKIERQFQRIELVVLISKTRENLDSNIFLPIKHGNIFLLINDERQQIIHFFFWKINQNVLQPIYNFEETLKSLKKFSTSKLNRHLKIAAFNYPPFVFIKSNTSINGIEPSLINLLAQSLNFTFQYIQPPNDELWGTITVNGENNTIITGIIGMLVKNEVDIAIPDMFIMHGRLSFMSFSLSYKSSYVCFIVPSPQPFAKWTSLYLPFALDLWMATLVFFILAIFTLKMLSQFTKLDANFFHMSNISLYTFGNIVGVVQRGVIRSTLNRLFLVLWLLRMFIVSNYYRTGFISYVTYPFTPPAIDTIKQIVEMPQKKMCLSVDENFQSFLLNSSEPNLKALGRQVIVRMNVEEGIALLNSTLWAILIEKYFGQYILQNRFPAIRTAPRFHQTNECLLPTLSALGLQKNSPLKTHFDQNIQDFIETGLIKYHLDKFSTQKTLNVKESEIENLLFTLNDLQGAFYLLFIGIGMASVSFILEIISSHYKVRKN